MVKKVTTKTARSWKGSDHKITSLTAYDATFGKLVDAAGIDIVLVGDSAGNVIAGHDSTIPMTMDQMIYHVSSVRRGVARALLVADMPFGSYQSSDEKGIDNAVRFIKEAGAEAVKLEGGKRITGLVKKLTESGVPVMGHLGLTPQSVNEFGGYHTQATSEITAERLIDDAQALQYAGAFSLVLEKIPAALAKKVTETVSIPTIGIGAGPDCDGQVLVIYDMLGLYDEFNPKFVRRYAHLADDIRAALSKFVDDVQSGDFPNAEESY